MTRAPLKHLNHSDRSLKASVTSLGRALDEHGLAHRPEWRLELKKLQEAVKEFGRLIGAERRALDEPHKFLRPRFGIWCLRCGGVKDRAELHPPELQVTNHEGAAQAVGGS